MLDNDEARANGINGDNEENLSPHMKENYCNNLKSPTAEDAYIRSTKLHSYHGKATNYYRDEAKKDVILTPKVCVMFYDIQYCFLKHDINNKIVSKVFCLRYKHQNIWKSVYKIDMECDDL